MGKNKGTGFAVQRDNEGLSRRGFSKGLAAVIVGAVGIGSLGGCKTGDTNANGAQTVKTDDVDSIAWEDEADFIVVGSGTGLIGAIAAAEKGAKVLVLEKSDFIGGVTFMVSGNSQWIPGNSVQEKEGYPYQGDEKVMKYLADVEAFHNSTEERKRDYVRNARKVNQYQQDNWGFKHTLTFIADYYRHEFAQSKGHSIDFFDESSGEPFYEGAQIYPVFIEPLLVARGIQILTGTPATGLIQDATGRVIGIRSNDKAYRSVAGVLMATGGFDWNTDMVRRYIEVPLGATQAYPENTGDGILIGQMIGADTENMNATWGGCAILTDPALGADDSAAAFLANPSSVVQVSADNIFDYGTYRGLPFNITVNRKGRRFFNESCSYAASSNVYDGYDSGANAYANVPAFRITSEPYILANGFPSLEATYDGTAAGANPADIPDFMRRFDTLEELADACGINKSSLINEIERFNSFVDAGIDSDFHRGEGPFDLFDEFSYGMTPALWERVRELPNKALAPITAPYYVAIEAPGSVNTCGGLRVNTAFQVLNVQGEVIEGFYASGSTAGGPLGACYGGAGGSVGPGYYGAFKAADTALGLALVDYE
jgi:hypothetical protein